MATARRIPHYARLLQGAGSSAARRIAILVAAALLSASQALAGDSSAGRELAEELGVELDPWAPTGSQPFFLTRTRTGGRSTSHIDVSLWYVFAGSEEMAYRADPREFAGARWWSFDHIIAAAATTPDPGFDPHLPRFVTKAVAAL